MDSLVVGWLVTGAVLVLLELVIPGAVLGFVGGAAMLTAVLIHFGHVSGFVNIMLTFFISSIFFVLVLRTALLKLYPSHSTVENTDELKDAVGRIVEVTETITPYKRGRIKYSEAGWEAQSESEIEAGEQAIIENRDGNCWIVKPLEGN